MFHEQDSVKRNQCVIFSYKDLRELPKYKYKKLKRMTENLLSKNVADNL